MQDSHFDFYQFNPEHFKQFPDKSYRRQKEKIIYLFCIKSLAKKGTAYGKQNEKKQKKTTGKPDYKYYFLPHYAYGTYGLYDIGLAKLWAEEQEPGGNGPDRRI